MLLEHILDMTTDDILDKYNVSVVNSDKYKDVVDSPAYTYQNYNHATIYISKSLEKDKDVRDFILDHELSHIVYMHTRNSMEGIAKEQIKIAIKERLEKEKKEKKLDSSLECFDINSLTDYMYENFKNIACDFEVNSKLYPSYRQAEKMFEKVAICLNSEEKRLGIHPGNINQLINKPEEEGIVGYPSGEDHVVYLKLIVKDIPFPNKDELLSNLLEHSGLSKEEIEDIKNKASASVDGAKEALDELIKNKANKENSPKRSLIGTSSIRSELSKISVYNNLQTYIISKLKKHDRVYETDLLYNYNRQKYSNRTDQVLIPKIRLMNDETIGNGVILADVSGSMPLDTIMKITSTIFSIKLPIKSLRLVTWDTDMTGDYLIKTKKAPNIKHGGGTNLSTGIEYCKKYLKNDSKLFIISDLEDDLVEWENSLKEIKHSLKDTFVISTNSVSDTERYTKYSNFKNIYCIEG